MALPFDKQRPIPSPALAPGGSEFERNGDAELTIALVNNMPDTALKATERQFMRLVQGAAGKQRVRFHYFALPSVARSQAGQGPYRQGLHRDRRARPPADRRADRHRRRADRADACPRNRYWREFTELVDWAKTNTRSTIWSCLAAHAAVLHLDGIERRRLPQKCSGVYECAKAP